MAFDATIELDTLDGTDGFVIEGGSGESLGISVTSIGDINGDGIDDFLVGAFLADTGASVDAGAAYVVFGTTAGFNSSIGIADLDGTNGFRISGSQSGGRVGISVAAAGDVNGDGVDDFMIGGYQIDISGAPNAGLTYIIFGNTAGFAADFDVDTVDGTNGFKMAGFSTNGELGRSVAGIGDVNDDGINDMAFGAPGAGGTGAAYVVFGSTTGFAATIYTYQLDGTNGFAIPGRDAGDEVGFSVSGAGDVNADGIDDFMVSGHRGDPFGSVDAGEAYVIYGTGSGFGASFNVDLLDGTNGFYVVGANQGDQAAVSLAAAGDVNGDGIDDIIVGAQLGDGATTDSGTAYVIYGSDTGIPTLVYLSSLDGTDGSVLQGINPDDRAGRRVASAGDFNGDGYDDIIVGANLADRGATSSGETYIVFGSASGFGASLALSSLDGSNGLILNGFETNAQSGFAVSGGGDFNADGYDDIVIGASGGNSGNGAAYIVFGGSDRATEGTSGDDSLSGRRGNDTLNGFEGNDRLNGRDGDDIMRGGAGDDQYFVSNLGDMVIELAGEGTDTVTSGVNYTLPDNVENLRLRGDATEGMGNELNNEIFSVAPGATLRGMGGNDNLRGSDFSETLFGGEGNDELNGRDGNDILIGDEGVDLLRGRNDDDTLRGGADRDTMRGGAGADTYVFFDGDFAGLTASDADRIGGFRSTEGDLIDLSAVDAITGTVEDDAFTFVGNEDFSGTAGELRWEFDGSRTMLYMDVDGDGAADHAIRLNGIVNLTEADFVL